MESNTIKGKAKIIIERWLSDIIDGSKIDASDNLIEKGLSSIQIMQLSGKLKKNGIIVPFAKLIENPSKEKWFSLVDTAKIKEVNQAKKDSRKISEAFPLTDVQYSYFIGREDDQTLGGIGCHAYLEIDGEGINPDRLNKAWNILQYRHPMLRARFIDDGHQEILEEPYSESIEIFNLSEKDKKEVEVQLKNIRNNISHRKLKVKEGQVADVKLALLPSGKHRIFFDIDLLVADVMSMSILLRELSELESFKIYKTSLKAQNYQPDIFLRDFNYVIAKDNTGTYKNFDKILDNWTEILMGEINKKYTSGNHYSCVENNDHIPKLASLLAIPELAIRG